MQEPIRPGTGYNATLHMSLLSTPRAVYYQLCGSLSKSSFVTEHIKFIMTLKIFDDGAVGIVDPFFSSLVRGLEKIYALPDAT
jgi:hypothetical protein